MTPPEIRLDVAWRRLLALAEEQAGALMRAAFSPVVREAGDLSAGIFDAHGRMLAQAETGTPGHVNTMARCVGHFLARFPLATMRAGDAFATNDPWLASGHLHDITLVSPCLHRGRAVGLAAVTIHLSDIGGRGQGPDAASLFEEGFQLPPMPIARAGVPDAMLLALLEANVRRPAELRGDLFACLAALRAAEVGLDRLLDELRLGDLDALSAHIRGRSAAAMGRAIAAWPRGAWAATLDLHDGPSPLHLAVRVALDGTRVGVDFAGTSPAVPRGVNVPLAYAAAYAAFALRCALAPEVPNNLGTLSLIEVHAPEGCLLNPARPAPVAARHVVGLFIPELVFAALAQARPGLLPAAGAGPLWTVQLSGHDWASQFSLAGGGGARAALPGLAATAFPSGARAIPVEVIEAASPVLIRAKELRAGSGGVGHLPGGDGQRVEIEAADGGAMRLYAMFARTREGAPGQDGGAPGAPGRAALADGTALAAQGMQQIPPGARLVLELPGGGANGGNGSGGRT